MADVQAGGRPSQADAFATAASFDIRDACVFRVPQGFSGATVFRVEGRRSGGACRFALRCWPAETERRRVKAVHRFVAFVAESADGRVSVPVSSVDGGTVAECCGRLWQAEPWQPGGPATPGGIRNDTADEIGTLLARLQRRAEEYDAGDCPWFGRHVGLSLSLRQRIDAAESLRSDPLRGEDGVATALLPRLQEELRCAATARPLRPCLRDLWSDSVLTDGRRVTGLIDLNAARVDDPAAVVARLFGSLAGPDAVLRSRMLDAYERVAPLDRGRVDLYDASGVVLSLLLWLKRVQRSEADATDPRVAGRIAALRDRLPFAASLLKSQPLSFPDGRTGGIAT